MERLSIGYVREDKTTLDKPILLCYNVCRVSNAAEWQIGRKRGVHTHGKRGQADREAREHFRLPCIWEVIW